MSLALAVGLALATPAPTQEVPPEGVRAESAGQWEEAIRIYRAVLAREPSRVDLLVRIADIEARLGRPAAAADALAEAARVVPDNAALQFRLARAQATLDRPKQALEAAERAVSLAPANPEYLRARGQLATWVGDYARARDSFQRVLELEPGDDGSLLGLARAEGWGGDLDAAARDYRAYLAKHPEEGEVLLEYARVQSWRGDFPSSLEILERYRKRFGDADPAYQADRVRSLAGAGRPTLGVQLVGPALEQRPNDYELNLAHTLARHAGRQPGEAVASLDALRRLGPDHPKTAEATRIVNTPTRPSVAVGGTAYADADDVTIYHGWLDGGFNLGAATRIEARIGGHRLRAPAGSGLEQVSGEEEADHAYFWVGLRHRFGRGLAFDARIGGAEADGEHQRVMYRVGLDIHLDDRLGVRLERESDFFLISPRTVGLGIRRDANRVAIGFQPALRYHVDVLGAYDELSDGNRRWELTLAPRRAVVRSQYLNMDLGLRGWWLGYRDDLNNGYYDPELFQRYQVTSFMYWKLSDNHGVSMTLAAGVGRDENNDFDFNGEASIEATFGIYHDWLLKVYASGIYNRLESGAFSGVLGGLTLTRRF